ncbi:hypothetical protein FPQ10_09835, partial [Allobacillus sp. SKP2-8]|uniref:PA14 domain-containing protein n=2 Tax=unclassified Allobacillus TaxID=2628859 RepID=UPI0011833F43
MVIVAFFVLFSEPLTSEGAAKEEWEGKIYDNVGLKGDFEDFQASEVNFDWGYKSPHSNISPDYFSIKLSKRFYLNEGVYNLRTWINDGVRVFVDGELYIDGWNNKSFNFYAKPFFVKSAGYHEIEIHYKELTDYAKLKFDLDDLTRDTRWYGLAFSNPDLTGETAL